MTERQANGIRRRGTVAGVGLALATVGLLAGAPTVIAVGLLMGWDGAFLTLIGFLDAQA